MAEIELLAYAPSHFPAGKRAKERLPSKAGNRLVKPVPGVVGFILSA
jgi:hypothetical protein